MQTFVSLMKLTQKGLAELPDSPSRRKISEARVADAGGRSVAFYAMLGAYDFVQIFEMPDDAAMMAYVLRARRDGHVEPLILPAFGAADYDTILQRAIEITTPQRKPNPERS